MKKHKSAALVPVRQAKPEVVEPEIVEPTALTVPVRMPKIQGKTPGERINFLHELSVESGKISIAAGILAGWELCRARAACDHGQWLLWLQKNTKITDQTARNYMSVYAQTLGAARAALPKPVPLEVQPTMVELEGACADVEAKSLTALYGQLRLLKRNPNHGGAREGAGRKSKAETDVGAALDAVANNEMLLWASAKGALDQLTQLDAERDFLHRLSDEHLATAVSCLESLAEKARRLFTARTSWKGLPGVVPPEDAADFANPRTIQL